MKYVRVLEYFDIFLTSN